MNLLNERSVVDDMLARNIVSIYGPARHFCRAEYV
jgi:hypothetical protein